MARSARSRNVAHQLALAVPPTVVVLAALFVTERVRQERGLFATLASSAFLVYAAPSHGMNTVRRMVLAHGVGATAGLGVGAILGVGYLAAAVATIVTIVVIVPSDLVHPPADSSTLGFGFNDRQLDTLVGFGAALALVVALVVLQRVAVAAVDRLARSTSTRESP